MSDIYTLAKNGKLTEKKLDEFLQNSQIDAENSHKRTLLVEAVRGGYPSVVELLIRKGAEVDKRDAYGRTPLHLAVVTRKNRIETVEALINAKADPDSADNDGNTPLMDAIARTVDVPVMKLLVAAGASTTKKNGLDQSAIDIANGKNDLNVKRAVLPADEQSPGRLEFIATIVNLVLFILAYVNSGIVRGVVKGVVSNFYHMIGNTKPDRETAKKIDNPETVDDFKKNIDNFVRIESPELSAFFKPKNDFFQKVAEKAVELKEDPNNHLKAPSQISDLTRLALYQPILYCDDSGSMGTVDTEKGPSRQELLRRLVTRMCSIATRLVPDGEGVHLRFINKDQPRTGAYDNLSKDQIDNELKFEPSGGTRIGTELRNKILKPFVFDVFARGQTLKRPILVIVITDGKPTDDDPDAFKNAIVECGQALVDKGYEPEACRFLVSRIGKDETAGNFLNALGGDLAIDRVVHRTSGPLDTKFSDLSKNEAHVEEWLLNVLMSPITGRSRS
ncbi:hypothetical protein BFW01_g7320 [Lasiodiplodia theobromae]|nr:hypothetical protein BFW01_g7320 [Lasiodiplodia theobromae]